MNFTNQSFQSYTTHLYSEISLTDLILYYFMIYILIKTLQKILNIKIKEESLPKLNTNILFIMSLIIIFQIIISKSFEYFPNQTILDTILIGGLVLIIIIYFIQRILEFIMNLIINNYYKIELKKELRENQKLSKNKLKKGFGNFFLTNKSLLLKIYIDGFVLIIFLLHYIIDYKLMIMSLILTIPNFYFSFKENLIDRVKKHLTDFKRNISHLLE